MRAAVLLAVALALVCSPVGHAAFLDIGVLTFDVLFPPDVGAPGVNVFNIANLTGDPAFGGFALPPDFPAFTPLTFLSATLSLNSGGSTLPVTLADIAPGFLVPPPELQVPDSSQFDSADFTATLSELYILLANGSTFTADSSLISVTLLPSLGPFLTANTDLAVISISGTIDLPEPEYTLLLPLILSLGLFRFRSRIVR